MSTNRPTCSIIILFFTEKTMISLIYRYYIIFIGIVVICIVVLWWYVSSQWSAPTADCWLVATRNPILLDTDEDLLDEASILRISNNLRAACCQQNILRDTDDIAICSQADIPSNQYFPQSIYLFDHIIDVMLRRLDWDPDLIYPDIELHPMGREWRQSIRELATDPSGVAPNLLVNTIIYYRYPSQSWEENLLSLYNKVCRVAYENYRRVAIDSPGANATARIAATSDAACYTMVQERIAAELFYARSIVSLMANRFLENYMTNSLVNYYANNRLIALQSTVQDIVNAFATVNRAVVEWTRQCSM